MKKIISFLFVLFVAVSANAQFREGTKYVNASLSNLGFSYSKADRFRFGLQLDAGYYIADRWMVHATAGYQHTTAVDDIFVGAGLRYNITQNGLFLGAGAELSHHTKGSTDLYIPAEVGYTFFLNRYLTIEPAVYYKMSLSHFGDNSTAGVRIGLGYYF